MHPEARKYQIHRGPIVVWFISIVLWLLTPIGIFILHVPEAIAWTLAVSAWLMLGASGAWSLINDWRDRWPK